ncbi:uncharacterized protein LOC129617815 [Condylostylus longicornis]|uniref:uncharacterized protein LOC129617815 n=1 Tax=Condylostylus longicornis TaxID=2530218 RepID=UPI00244E19AA|nr:uncharacterized protein LOC129617815 [Condylostylus longicornis]
MQTMDQFSHDLTLALEETSKGVLRGRWGPRRRTRSTGNLPCAPQPTEDSSSSPTDAQNEVATNQNIGDGLFSVHSDSDDRHDFRSAFPKARHNFESDSLNENFSPARFFRPNKMKERRKRKFKRMAVEYETTPSTPGPKTGNILSADNVDTQNINTPSNNTNVLPSSANLSSNSFFPVTGAVKKRVLKHSSIAQENFRTNLFFCGKRKRSHRDHRYHDHHDYYGKQHSSSVPRQSHIFAPKNSYPEHKVRTRSFSSNIKPNCEKILPLQKGLITKIERMSAAQQQQHPQPNLKSDGFKFKPIISTSTASNICANSPSLITESPSIFETKNTADIITSSTNQPTPSTLPKIASPFKAEIGISTKTTVLSHIPENITIKNSENNSGTLKIETLTRPTILNPITSLNPKPSSELQSHKSKHSSGERRRRHKNNRLKREQIRAQLQFDDPHSMECGNDLNDFVSSSSLSSSDSEDGETNESDREGDDELTDWPGNEVMVNFASKNDFKRKSNKKPLPLIKSSDDYAAGGDDDTLMSGDEVLSPPGGVTGTSFSSGIQIKSSMLQSQPIAINSGNAMNFNTAIGVGSYGFYSGGSNSFGLSENLSEGQNVNSSSFINANDGLGETTTNFRFPIKQIESEMSGETSNPFLASPPFQSNEIREIRAGCRRIREERPGFVVRTSVNERLARFLQDARQIYIRLPDLEIHEQESLTNLAKLYSLQMTNDNGCTVLTKTSNTTQSVKIDQPNFSHRFLFSDYKRRCFDTTNVHNFEDTNERLTDCINIEKCKDNFDNGSRNNEENILCKTLECTTSATQKPANSQHIIS